MNFSEPEFRGLAPHKQMFIYPEKSITLAEPTGPYRFAGTERPPWFSLYT
jgi:hypothetical protein